MCGKIKGTSLIMHIYSLKSQVSYTQYIRNRGTYRIDSLHNLKSIWITNKLGMFAKS